MWKIELDRQPHKIELLVSSVSGMKRILINGHLILEKQLRFGNFHHTMTIDKHMISIIEIEDRYDFRINNQPFAALYFSGQDKKHSKPKTYSKKHEDDHEKREKKVTYEEPKIRKVNTNVEFDTGFGKFDYKPTRESLKKHYTQRTKPEPEFITGPWEDKTPQETFNWNTPSNFQLNEPTRNNTSAYNQPAPLVHIQQPPKEQPIIDFLDIDQPNNLHKDLSSDSLNIIPPTPQQSMPLQIHIQPPTVVYPQLDKTKANASFSVESPMKTSVNQPIVEEKKTPSRNSNAYNDTTTGIKFL